MSTHNVKRPKLEILRKPKTKYDEIVYELRSNLPEEAYNWYVIESKLDKLLNEHEKIVILNEYIKKTYNSIRNCLKWYDPETYNIFMEYDKNHLSGTDYFTKLKDWKHSKKHNVNCNDRPIIMKHDYINTEPAELDDQNNLIGKNTGRKHLFGNYKCENVLDKNHKLIEACSKNSKNIKIIRKLGEGSYGTVFLANAKLNSNKKPEQVAVKRIEITNPKKLQDLFYEVEYSEYMASKGIGPKIYDAFYNVSKSTKGKNAGKEVITQYIIMEPGDGSVEDLMLRPKNKKVLIQNTIGEMIKLITEHVNHDMFCLDIKPGNFIYKSNGKNKIPMVKMIDFGKDFCYLNEIPQVFTKLSKEINDTNKNMFKKMFNSNSNSNSNSKFSPKNIFVTLMLIQLFCLIDYYMDEVPKKQRCELFIPFFNNDIFKTVITDPFITEQILSTIIKDKNIGKSFVHYVAKPNERKNKISERVIDLIISIYKECL